MKVSAGGDSVGSHARGCCARSPSRPAYFSTPRHDWRGFFNRRQHSSRHTAATSLPSLSNRSAVAANFRTTCSGLCVFLVAMISSSLPAHIMGRKSLTHHGPTNWVRPSRLANITKSVAHHRHSDLGFSSYPRHIALKEVTGDGTTKFRSRIREGAVRIVRETGGPIARVARELCLNEGTLGRWVNLDRQAWEGEGPVNES